MPAQMFFTISPCTYCGKNVTQWFSAYVMFCDILYNSCTFYVTSNYGNFSILRIQRLKLTLIQFIYAKFHFLSILLVSVWNYVIESSLTSMWTCQTTTVRMYLKRYILPSISTTFQYCRLLVKSLDHFYNGNSTCCNSDYYWFVF